MTDREEAQAREASTEHLMDLARGCDLPLLGDILSEMAVENCLEARLDFDQVEQVGYLHRSGVDTLDLLAALASAGSEAADEEYLAIKDRMDEEDHGPPWLPPLPDGSPCPPTWTPPARVSPAVGPPAGGLSADPDEARLMLQILREAAAAPGGVVYRALDVFTTGEVGLGAFLAMHRLAGLGHLTGFTLGFQAIAHLATTVVSARVTASGHAAALPGAALPGAEIQRPA